LQAWSKPSLILGKLFGKGQTLRLVYPCANGQNKLECLALVIFGASLMFASKARAYSKKFGKPKNFLGQTVVLFHLRVMRKNKLERLAYGKLFFSCKFFFCEWGQSLLTNI